MRVTAVLLFLILLTAKPSAQTGTVDGTWRLDAGRSDAPLMGRRGNQASSAAVTAEMASDGVALLDSSATSDAATITIARDAKLMTLSRSDGSPVLSLTLDGVSRPIAGGGATATLAGRVYGTGFIVERSGQARVPGHTPAPTLTTETFVVAEDGTLRHELKITSGGAVHVSRFVYERVK